MSFENAALTRLGRYRREADRSLEHMRQAGEAAGRFYGRLVGGLERTAALGRRAGFEMRAGGGGDLFELAVSAGPGAEIWACFALLPGVAAETDEDLVHEELSGYGLDPSGYSGRVLGWTEAAVEEPCQTFAVYRDGVWKTRGLLVAKARGHIDDPEDVLHGFCLRILGCLVDLSALTGGAGRRWAEERYTIQDFRERRPFPAETRFPR